MIDSSNQWLIQQLQQCQQGNNLWCCDENVLNQIPNAQQWPNKPKFISNRWDIAQQATQLGFNSEFSDFDLQAIADNSIDHFFYRISKEKAVTHHLINQACRVLKPEGILWICGQKNEGIKTYIEKACALFGSEKNIQKDGANYCSNISKFSSSNPLLDNDDYSQLRACFNIHEHEIYSKPGQFGWNKIDQGSDFLIAEISQHVAKRDAPFTNCLDLGCGYGFLSIASQSFPITKRVLTDNNAAALMSAQHNCTQLGLNAEIIPSDAGQQLTGQFELILCNPPFHQGFSIDGDLTDKFLRNTKRLLAKQGAAYFVVNQFIPVEKKAIGQFKTIKVLAQNKGFKVVELRHN